MRLISLLVLLSSTLIGEKLTLGAGAYFQTQPYKGVDTILLPSPVIFYDNSLFYVRWSRAGFYFLGKKTQKYAWGLSLTLQPRPYGYEEKDALTLTGMQQRKNTVEGGIALSISAGDAYIESMLLTDMLNNHDAWLCKTELGYDFELADFTFYPSLILLYNSAAFHNYYYGVKKSEATPSRPSYNATSGLQYGAQTYIKYPITQKLATLINLRADILSKEANSSPIVQQNTIYSGLVSLIYTFEY